MTYGNLFYNAHYVSIFEATLSFQLCNDSSHEFHYSFLTASSKQVLEVTMLLREDSDILLFMLDFVMFYKVYSRIIVLTLSLDHS